MKLPAHILATVNILLCAQVIAASPIQQDVVQCDPKFRLDIMIPECNLLGNNAFDKITSFLLKRSFFNSFDPFPNVAISPYNVDFAGTGLDATTSPIVVYSYIENLIFRGASCSWNRAFSRAAPNLGVSDDGPRTFLFITDGRPASTDNITQIRNLYVNEEGVRIVALGVPGILPIQQEQKNNIYHIACGMSATECDGAIIMEDYDEFNDPTFVKNLVDLVHCNGDAAPSTTPAPYTPTGPPPEEGKCGCYDLVVLLDSSPTIGLDTFKLARNWIANNFITALGSSEAGGTRIAFIGFSSTVKLTEAFSTKLNKMSTDIQASFVYDSTQSDVAVGINAAITLLKNTTVYARQGILLVSDGKWSNTTDAIAAADHARSLGIRLNGVIVYGTKQPSDADHQTEARVICGEDGDDNCYNTNIFASSSTSLPHITPLVIGELNCNGPTCPNRGGLQN